MSTPNTATQGSQSANANAPQKPADKQTTTQPRAEGTNLMDFLDVPKEVQAQVAPKTVEPMTGDIPASHPRTEETPTPTEEQNQSGKQEGRKGESDTDDSEKPAAILEDDDDEDDDDGLGENNQATPATEAQQQELTRKEAKLLKRIGRQTRKLSEKDSQLDLLHQQLTDLKGKVSQFEGNGADKADVPTAGGWLPNIADERQLDTEVSKARDLIQWCNENSEGVTSGEGEKQKFISPKEISGWKTQAEMVLLGAEPRRRELREFTQTRSQYDTLSKQAWPEIFDPKTEEYQLAQSLLAANPYLKSRPDKHYALGLLVEGVKGLHTRIQAAAKAQANGQPNGNGQQQQRRDIDPRAFEPRVPLAPSGPDIPTREVVPSSHKKLNQAMSDLVADTDGSASSLANALAALDETRRTRAGSRTPVKV